MLRYNGDIFLDEEELRQRVSEWYGRLPSVQTVRLWVRNGRLNPIDAVDLPNWLGHHRAKLYNLTEINQLQIKWNKSQGDDLFLVEFYNLINQQSKYDHSLTRVRQLLIDGVIPSWNDSFKPSNPYRINRREVKRAVHILDSEIVPENERRNLFMTLYAELQNHMSKSEIARRTGISASYWAQREHGDQTPSINALDKLMELKEEVGNGS